MSKPWIVQYKKHKIMKKFILLSIIAVMLLPVTQYAQDVADSTGYAGDNFSLEGALELLKQSKSPEEFEKKLNSEDSYVNNLDLNEDGKIDYVKVIDNMDGEVHAMAFQVDVIKDESQDIAVILLEKTGKENAILQIIGDEDVYGEEKIVEPYAESMEAGGKGMPMETFASIRISVNVWAWPSVRYVYAPTYVVYHSPWTYSYYPRWWNPWRPHPWRWHYSKRTVYHVHYRPYHKHRVVRAHNFYKPKRRSSVTVRTRTVHTRTVVKKGKKGPAVSKTTVKKETTVSRKNQKGKVQSKTTTQKSKTNVASKKGVKVEREKSKTSVTGKKGNKVEREKTKTSVKTKKGAKVEKKKTKTTAKSKKGTKVKREKTKTTKKSRKKK